MKQRGKLWTDEQDAQLEQLVKAKTPRAEIAKIMERTPRAIQLRIHKNGLRQDAAAGSAPRAWAKTRWTGQEDHQFELMLEGKATIPQICAALERTERSLHDRATALGLRHLFDNKATPVANAEQPPRRGDGAARHRTFRKPLSDLYDMWDRAMVWT